MTTERRTVRRARPTIAFLLALSTITCGESRSVDGIGTTKELPRIARPVTEHDTRAVMEAVLRDDGLLGAAERPMFHRDVDVGWLRSDHGEWWSRAELRAGALTSFFEANESGVRDDAWLGALGAGMIESSVLDAHFADRTPESGWASVLRGPPECTVLVSITAPGFSEDGHQALIFMSTTRGFLEGGGLLYLLEHQQDTWVVADYLVELIQ